MHLKRASSQRVNELRKSIQENTRSQIQALCSEPNLSQQQKHEKIREIRQAAHDKVNAMISPAERQKLEACHRAAEIIWVPCIQEVAPPALTPVSDSGGSDPELASRLFRFRRTSSSHCDTPSRRRDEVPVRKLASRLSNSTASSS